MERKAFGKLADGEEATLYTISNTKGMYAQITDFGASIVSLVVKDKDGKNTDVVLGYENAETYQQQMASFGAVVGRNCNRIANAEIVIDGVTYQLEKNDNEIDSTVDHRTNGYRFRKESMMHKTDAAI